MSWFNEVGDLLQRYKGTASHAREEPRCRRAHRYHVAPLATALSDNPSEALGIERLR